MGSTPVIADLRLADRRAALRPVGPEDIDAAFEALHGRPEILDWLVWNGPERRADLEPFYGSWRRGDSGTDIQGRDGARDYALAVVDLADGAFAGCISLRCTAHPGVGDLGYWIAHERWGQGLASEAVRLTSWLAFDVLALNLVFANVFLGNGASRRVLEKSGYTVDREVSVEVDGTERTEWCLNVTARAFQRAVGDWTPVETRVELSDPAR